MPALFAFRLLVLLDLVPVPVLLPLVPLDLVPVRLPLALLDLVPLDLVPALVLVPGELAPDIEHTKGTDSAPIFQEAKPRNKSLDTQPPETETPQGRPPRKVIPFQFFSSHVQENDHAPGRAI